jgi:ubiquinone/menaquinone biosynthesis C-methylase UbiE
MSSYDNFADEYSSSMAEEGDFHHRTSIDPQVYSMIGDAKGKYIYDIGCGNGYMARKLANQGAKVFASDLSEKLIKIAKEKSKGLDIQYMTHDATDFSSYKDNFFDCVFMNMVIHYVEDLDKLFAGVNRVLKKGGKFVFSTSHFFRPGYPYSEWVEGDVNGEKRLFIKVTGYLKPYDSKVISWWDNKTELRIINRPLNMFVNKMSEYGLYTSRIEEPESVGFAKDFSKELQGSHHIPTFIVIEATKK